MKIDLEYIRTVIGKGDDGIVSDLGTFVQFELCFVSRRRDGGEW